MLKLRGHKLIFRPLTVFAMVLFLYFLFLIWQDFQYFTTLDQERKNLKLKYLEGQSTFQSLAEKAELEKNNAYFEAIARERLGLIKRGETAYRIIKR